MNDDRLFAVHAALLCLFVGAIVWHAETPHSDARVDAFESFLADSKSAENGPAAVAATAPAENATVVTTSALDARIALATNAAITRTIRPVTPIAMPPKVTARTVATSTRAPASTQAQASGPHRPHAPTFARLRREGLVGRELKFVAKVKTVKVRVFVRDADGTEVASSDTPWLGFVPRHAGTFEVVAIGTNKHGVASVPSEPVRIDVRDPGAPGVPSAPTLARADDVPPRARSRPWRSNPSYGRAPR